MSVGVNMVVHDGKKKHIFDLERGPFDERLLVGLDKKDKYRFLIYLVSDDGVSCSPVLG